MIFQNRIKVYAFVGPSGTGKSYRAQMIANENGINYIIDDGLFIKDNQVIAGSSAKKAPTKIETVKHALFMTEEEKQEIMQAIKKYRPNGILILGTSDSMVHKIVENLGLPEISKIIYIEDIATQKEMETARRIRTTEGKHVIPVPTFEIKKEFSGYLLDPLQIFKTKGKGKAPYISEKSIIRPTFSYMGNFTISENVFKEIIEHIAEKTTAIAKINKIRIDSVDTVPHIYIEIILVYGYNIVESINSFNEKLRKEIEKLTAMTINKIDVVAKGIKLPEK